MEMIKTSEFIEQYKQGKVAASTLIKMAAFKDELEKGIKDGKLDGLVKQAAGMVPGFTYVNGVQMVREPAAWLKTLGAVAVGAPGKEAWQIASQEAKETVPFVKNLGNWFSKDLAKGESSGILKIVAMGVLGAGFATFLEAVKALEGKIVDWTTDLKKPKLFEEMLEVHPDMRELPLDRVKLYFEALLHFSPVMAENPLAAGSYIKQAMKYDHVAQGPLPASIQEIGMIEKNKRQAVSDVPSSSYIKNILFPISSGFGLSGKD